MKNKLKAIIFIMCIASILLIPFQIFANGPTGTYDHKLTAGIAGENTKIEFWGTGYIGYYKILNLHNSITSEQIDSILTIDVNADPWDLELNNILPTGSYYYNIIIADDYDIFNSEVYAIPPIIVDETYYFNISAKKMPVKSWIRTMPMMCQYVWINEDNHFQFKFLYPYADNNWVKIYSMNEDGSAGELVFEKDMPWLNPNLIVDLPDGMYRVYTYHTDMSNPIQIFEIGKP